MSLSGRLVYLAWHKPRAELRQCIADGGPLEQWKTYRGRTAMERAAEILPALPPSGGPPLELYLLTGIRPRSASGPLPAPPAATSRRSSWTTAH